MASGTENLKSINDQELEHNETVAVRKHNTYSEIIRVQTVSYLNLKMINWNFFYNSSVLKFKTVHMIFGA